MKRALLLLPLLLAACESGLPGEQKQTLVPEPTVASATKANTFAAGDQQFPAVARNGRGDVVVVWESSGQDGSHLGIYGQRYRQGQPLGAEFRVNTYTRNRQSFPAVAIDGAGNFAVVWRSSRQDGNGGTIFGQRFDAAGLPLAGEFQIGPSDSDYDSQSEPAIAMNERGDFVVVWSNRELSETALGAGLNNVETRMVQARAYAADGSARTAVINVMLPTVLAIVRAPAVGIDAAGNFAVAWISESNPTGIRVHRLTADGRNAGLVQTVSALRDDAELDMPALAMNAAGDFAVAWEAVYYGDARPDGIYLRRFDAAAGAFSAETRIAEAAQGFAGRPAAALNDAGELALAAHAADGVYLMAQSAGGGMLLAPTRLSPPEQPALFPSVALDGAGGATVAWHGWDAAGGRDIYVREIALR